MVLPLVSALCSTVQQQLCEQPSMQELQEHGLTEGHPAGGQQRNLRICPARLCTLLHQHLLHSLLHSLQAPYTNLSRK